MDVLWYNLRDDKIYDNYAVPRGGGAVSGVLDDVEGLGEGLGGV